MHQINNQITHCFFLGCKPVSLLWIYQLVQSKVSTSGTTLSGRRASLLSRVAS